MLLREFLYVDLDRVRGLLAQLDEGIVEASTETEKAEKLSGAGFKGLAEHSQRWGTERAVQKSQGDALFPTLEGALESLGLLTDLSADLQDVDFWTEEKLQSLAPPGTLVRVTAPGALFDARYVASTLAAFATTMRGLSNLGIMPPSAPPKLQKGQQGGQLPKARNQPASTSGALEDAIPDGDLNLGDEPMKAEFLRGIVRVSRGVFTPGLHLNLLPAGTEDSHAITARLQEGRQFMDGDAEVLFARYGTGLQEWTLVGSVGHYADVVDEDLMEEGVVGDDDSIRRARFARYVNGFMAQLGSTGFVDVPQAPGFSVVPLAVYRVVGQTTAWLTEPAG